MPESEHAKGKDTSFPYGEMEKGENVDIETLLTALRYPPEVEQALRRKLGDPQLKAVAGTAYDGENFAFPLCKQKPLTRLAVVTFLLTEKWEAYRERGPRMRSFWTPSGMCPSGQGCIMRKPERRGSPRRM